VKTYGTLEPRINNLRRFRRPVVKVGLNAGITHYGTGSAPIYFEAGYVGGNLVEAGLADLGPQSPVVAGVGSLWWKLVGLW
jgi:hypothetical protein